MSQLADQVEAAREALDRHAWREALDLLKEADSAKALSAEELELLAEAATWAAELKDAMSAIERAFAAHVKAGNRRRAALLATTLAHHYGGLLQKSRAQGWLGQAERLLDQEPEETVEHGWLAIQKALVAFNKGDLESMLALGREAERLGRKFGDRNVEIIGIQRQGMALVGKGEIDEGLGLLDLASAAAAAGELAPWETLVVYCNTIGACRDRADYGRAFEWADIAKDWCESFGATTGFPGLCRVNRAEVLRHRGAYEAAEEEARHAVEDLHALNPRITGEAFYEIGEIKLRLGRLREAQEAFDQAHELGRTPEPGNSLLRLAEGRIDAAALSIRLALSDDSLMPLQRARTLPAQVEIALASGDVERARAAKDELVEIARTHDTDALVARAAAARGAVELADGNVESAINCLRQSFRKWHEDASAPYDAARVRLLLAEAYRRTGDADAAERELRAARKTFEELGARLDAEHAASLLGVDTGKRVTRTFMFTDIVGSTGWAEQLGEAKWKNLLRKHNELVDAAIADSGGEVVKTIGDGYFAAFDSPLRSIEAAVAIQRVVDAALPFHVRIGLHTTEATERERDYEGAGVHAAARIASLAQGGEIVASKVCADCDTRFPISEPRLEALKGFEEPVEVVSIGWRRV